MFILKRGVKVHVVTCIIRGAHANNDRSNLRKNVLHLHSSSASSSKRDTTSFGLRASGLKFPPEITIFWIWNEIIASHLAHAKTARPTVNTGKPTSLFSLALCNILSSIDPLVTSLYTVTCRVWPKRCARSIAWEWWTFKRTFQAKRLVFKRDASVGKSVYLLHKITQPEKSIYESRRKNQICPSPVDPLWDSNHYHKI